MNMVIFTPLALSLYWMLTLVMLIPDSGEAYELNLAEDSVDDMYHGCGDKMKEILSQMYAEEMKNWTNFEDCATKNLDKRVGEDMALTKDHLQAICMYTNETVYKEFIKEVSKKGKDYKSFKFHILHFHLTSAIQTLNSKHTCRHTYKRTKDEFTGKVKQKIRFGSFASSSFRTNLTKYGSKTCFEIKTCLGAPLNHFSVNEHEEVLIPPYETFVIKAVHKPVTVEGLADCEVLFNLEAEGLRSALNCNRYEVDIMKWLLKSYIPMSDSSKVQH